MKRKVARVDANQSSIVSDLRDVPGVTVRSLAAVGAGMPDLLVGFRGRNFLFEVKNPAKPASKRKLTELEQGFFMNWGGQVNRIETADEALKLMGVIAA